MSQATTPPDNPAGPFDPSAAGDARSLTEALAETPRLLRRAVEGLPGDALDVPYRNWSVRQIVHHVADSHLHSYVRFKWTLTEDEPVIKAYDEGAWSRLPDARSAAVGPSLALLDGLHGRWDALLRAMSADDFGRGFTHPETGGRVTLGDALAYYVWHGRHHAAQIDWVREHRLA